MKQFWILILLSLLWGILIVPVFSSDEPGSWSEVSVQNMDFETSTFWASEPPGLESWAYETSLVYHGNRSLKMWADGSDDFQRQHDAIAIEAKCSYILSGWINVTETNNGGYAFLSMAFRASNGTWVHWPESEYINVTSGWVNVHVAGVCPENAVAMRILCRVRGNGGNCTAYFDYLELKVARSYDGGGYALGLGILGIALIVFTPLYTIYRLRRKDHKSLVWAFLLLVIGIGLVIAWLLS